MTGFDVVYDAFLTKMLDDEWQNWEEEEVRQDLHSILMGALNWFKFPRVSLDYTDEGFTDDLTNEEVLWCLDKALQKEYINDSTKEDVIKYLRLL